MDLSPHPAAPSRENKNYSEEEDGMGTRTGQGMFPPHPLKSPSPPPADMPIIITNSVRSVVSDHLPTAGKEGFGGFPINPWTQHHPEEKITGRGVGTIHETTKK